jgi:hypothetical protein
MIPLLLAGAMCVLSAHADHQLGVLLDVKQELSASVRMSMRQEFNRLVATPGLDIRWSALGDAASKQAFDRVVIVRMHGACSGKLPDGYEDVSSDTLAYTHVSDGKVLPFAELECDRIRATLHPVIWSKSRQDRAIFVGRALGRVLAHEVYHMITRSTEHSRKGIARESLTPVDLTCERFAFEEECVQRIRSAMKLVAQR